MSVDDRVTAAQQPAVPWLTAQDVAAQLQIGIKLIYRAVKAGRLRAAHLNGRRYRFRQDWVDAWVESCTLGRTE